MEFWFVFLGFFFGDCMVIRGTLLNNVERDYQTV